jgi:hypothetical protein
MGQFQQKQTQSTSFAHKNTSSCVQECVRITKMFDGGITSISFNAEFMCNNTVCKEVQMSIQSYKILSLSGLPF